MTFSRIITGCKGLAAVFGGGLLGRWIAGFLLSNSDIDQATYNAAGGCLTSMVLAGTIAYLVWLIIRSGKLEKAVNPGRVHLYYKETLSGALLAMIALYLFVAVIRIGFGSFEDVTALTIGAIITGAFSLGSLYGGLHLGTSDL